MDSEPVESQEILDYLRVQFDKEVSKEFCINDEDAQGYLELAQGTPSTVTAAFLAVHRFLEREAKENQHYQEEEICSTLVPRFIGEELKLISEQQPKVVQVVPQRIKSSRGGSRSELKAEIERRIAQQLSDEEFRDLCNTSGNRPLILLQAARNTAKHSQGVSHEHAMKKLQHYLQKEIGKLPSTCLKNP